MLNLLPMNLTKNLKCNWSILFTGTYLLLIIIGLIIGLFLISQSNYFPGGHSAKDYAICAIVGGLAGCIYCLRGIYLNRCVRKNWDTDWTCWYYIRPLVSLLCGAASRLFVQAGLIILEAEASASASHAGFWSLAFLAGYNCDKFLQRIESIGKVNFGIETSRASKIGDQTP